VTRCAITCCLFSLVAQSSGDGVTVGDSALFDTIDYADTFTGTDDGGLAGRPYVAAVLSPVVVEQVGTNAPPRNFHIGGGFSIAADGPGTPGFVNGSPAYPLGNAPNASGAGSDTGFTQTGGSVDYGVSYGMRDRYWVQVDAVQTADRVNISSGAGPGTAAAHSLSVFFQGDGSGDVSLSNGTTNTSVQGSGAITNFHTGITGPGAWHNYAVRFDQAGNELEIYVGETSIGLIDLGTFAGGVYAGYSNTVVGAGASVGGGNRTWTDNFQVGGMGALSAPAGPLPDPGDLAGLPESLISYWDFDEAAGPVPGFLLDFAYDRQGDRDGSFVGTVTRVPGLIGLGAAGFSVTNGLTVEALATTTWNGLDQAEFFRKEDGGNRILLSFQSGGNINNNSGQLVGTAGTPGISFGANVNGAYQELDIAFDGLDGRPSLAEINDGGIHHFVATLDAASGFKAIYVDGALIGSVDVGDGVTLTTGGTAPAMIGASGGREPFAGLLDEVAIYREGLTAGEVETHFSRVQGGRNYFDESDFELVITRIRYDAFSREFELRWHSLPNRVYVIEASTRLPNWFELVDTVASEGLSTASGVIDLDTIFIDPVDTPDRLYLRIRDRADP
jgi:hypothetical protein